MWYQIVCTPRKSWWSWSMCKFYFHVLSIINSSRYFECDFSILVWATSAIIISAFYNFFTVNFQVSPILLNVFLVYLQFVVMGVLSPLCAISCINYEEITWFWSLRLTIVTNKWIMCYFDNTLWEIFFVLLNILYYLVQIIIYFQCCLKS